MRRIALFLAVAVSLVLLVSCGNKKQEVKPTGPEKPVYTFTKEEMLNFLDRGDSIRPLNAIEQRRQAMSLKVVQGIKYDLNRMTLRSNTNNEVKIDITLFEKPEGKSVANTTSFFLRPVKFEEKWYLTVWDNITNTNQDRNKD